jgi:hypothetical protein
VQEATRFFVKPWISIDTFNQCNYLMGSFMNEDREEHSAHLKKWTTPIVTSIDSSSLREDMRIELTRLAAEKGVKNPKVQSVSCGD